MRQTQSGNYYQPAGPERGRPTSRSPCADRSAGRRAARDRRRATPGGQPDPDRPRPGRPGGRGCGRAPGGAARCMRRTGAGRGRRRPPADRESLVDALARLDLAHEAGELTDAAYRDQRLRLKAQLRDLLSKEGQGERSSARSQPGCPKPTDRHDRAAQADQGVRQQVRAARGRPACDAGRIAGDLRAERRGQDHPDPHPVQPQPADRRHGAHRRAGPGQRTPTASAATWAWCRMRRCSTTA